MRSLKSDTMHLALQYHLAMAFVRWGGCSSSKSPHNTHNSSFKPTTYIPAMP
jgi:hypothetical protein